MQENIPDYYNNLDKTYSIEESKIDYNNFCVIETFIKSIGWLFLAAKGHSCAYFSFKNKLIEKKWLIP